MPNAVIVDAVRTAGGKRNGKLSGWHPADLAAEVLKALAERNQLDPALVDDVIMGCVSQVGSQGLNIGRNAVLAAGWPESVPATTVDRQCGSSQQAAHFAAQGVIAGAYDIAVAAGVEVMTTNPMGSSMTPGSIPFGHKVLARYSDPGLVPQGISAEMIADKWGISRGELDAFGAESQNRAERAADEGRFDNEIVGVTEKRLDKETGNLIFHLAMLGVIVAFAAGHLLGWRGEIIIKEGQSWTAGPASFDTLNLGPLASTDDIPTFTVQLDEPKELGGADTGPNPVEAVLAALGSCQAIVYRAYANALGLEIDRVEVDARGHLDVRGFLNLAPVPAGFERVTFTTRVVSPEPAEKIAALEKLVAERCPVLDILRTAIPVTGELEHVTPKEGRAAA